MTHFNKELDRALIEAGLQAIDLRDARASYDAAMGTALEIESQRDDFREALEFIAKCGKHDHEQMEWPNCHICAATKALAKHGPKTEVDGPQEGK